MDEESALFVRLAINVVDLVNNPIIEANQSHGALSLLRKSNFEKIKQWQHLVRFEAVKLWKHQTRVGHD